MTLLSSSKIKFIRSLSQKKIRQESGLFVVEGEKIVKEAIESNFNVKEIFHIADIGEECMKRISNLTTPSPVLAIVEQPVEELTFDSNKLYNFLTKNSSEYLFLALDSIKDPGNLGTIIRIADWFGIDAIFASEDTVEMYNPKVVQSTMGAIFRKPVIYCNLSALIDTFIDAGAPVYGTFLDGESIYTKKEDNFHKGLIVMGSESFGISDVLKKKINNRLFIPPYPDSAATSESLNVAVATAIICAEFRSRQ